MPLLSFPSRRLQRLAAVCVAAATFALAGCSEKTEATNSPTAATATTPAQGLERAAAQGKGFTVGALMSANTVYVFFDPQCPHCGRLWQQAEPLLKKAKFVWMPVAFINAKSAPQGAALLSAANPQEAMQAHEASLLSGAGGMSASANVPDDLAAAIQQNTALLNGMGVGSVPYLMAKNSSTGTVVTNEGVLETAALAKLLGLE